MWWLMPIILAIQEAEIRRMAVHGHSRQKVLMTLSQLIKAGHTLIIPSTWKA
jgi:hypothetical protein